MPSASGQLTALRMVGESEYGVAAGTRYKALRFTDSSINLKKAVYQSNEIRSDRMKSDVRHGMRSVAGDINVELGIGTFDDLLEGALSGTFEEVTTGLVSLSSDSSDNSFNRLSGSFITDGFLPGDVVVASGFSASSTNARAKVLSVTALKMVVDLDIATSDTAAPSREVALVGRRMSAGTILRTFQFERAFLDVDQFLNFSGCAIDQMQLSIKPEEIITGSFSVIGKDMTVDDSTHAVSGVDAPATNSPFDAFTGTLMEGGDILAYITGIELTVSNGRQVKGVIGQRSPQEVFEGTCDVQGTLTAFFPSAALLTKFLDEVESTIDVQLDDMNGVDFHRIRIPRVKYNGGDLDNPKEGPITLTLPFTGLLDPVANTSLVYQVSNS